MIEAYCPNCGKVTGHKRATGMGTFLGAILTVGVSLAATPFYPKRCVVCGCKSEGEWKIDPQTGKYKKVTEEDKREKLIKKHEIKMQEGKGDGLISKFREGYIEGSKKDK